MPASLPVLQRRHVRPRGWRVHLCRRVARHVVRSSLSARLLRRRVPADLPLRSTSSLPPCQRTLRVSARLRWRELHRHLSARHLGTRLQPGNAVVTTSIRLRFVGLSTAYQRSLMSLRRNRSHVDLFIYLRRTEAARSRRRSSNGCSAVELQSNCSRIEVKS